MNALLVTGNYPWTVVPVEQRKTYMSALDQASTRRNIVPFAQFLGKLISEQRERPLERPQLEDCSRAAESRTSALLPATVAARRCHA